MKKFFFFLLGFALSKLYSFDFRNNICNLWSDSSGVAILFNWNLNDYLPVKKHKFFAGANIFYLDSSVEYFKGSAFKGDFCAEYANDFFGISANFGFVSAGSLSVAAEHIFTQEEICGFNGKIAVPFYVKEFSVKPYFGFFSGKSKKRRFLLVLWKFEKSIFWCEWHSVFIYESSSGFLFLRRKNSCAE